MTWTSQKKVKLSLGAITVLYALLYPCFFYGFLLSSLVFDSSRMPIPLGLAYMFTVLLVPLSVPLAVYLMWRNYLKGQVKRAFRFALLPILVIFFAVAVCFILDKIFISLW